MKYFCSNCFRLQSTSIQTCVIPQKCFLLALHERIQDCEIKTTSIIALNKNEIYLSNPANLL